VHYSVLETVKNAGELWLHTAVKRGTSALMD